MHGHTCLVLSNSPTTASVVSCSCITVACLSSSSWCFASQCFPCIPVITQGYSVSFLQTAHRTALSHPKYIHRSNHTHSLTAYTPILPGLGSFVSDSTLYIPLKHPHCVWSHWTLSYLRCESTVLFWTEAWLEFLPFLVNCRCNGRIQQLLKTPRLTHQFLLRERGS